MKAEQLIAHFVTTVIFASVWGAMWHFFSFNIAVIVALAGIHATLLTNKP